MICTTICVDDCTVCTIFMIFMKMTSQQCASLESFE